MIRVSVLYPQKEGAPFDWAYYTSTHMPLVGRRLGSALKGMAVEQGISGGSTGSPAPFVAIANLTFDSVAAFEDAFAPHASEIMSDISKYTSIEPLMQISEIKLGV